MTALSTSFASGRFTDGEALLAALEEFDIAGIELEYRISEKVFHQMKPLLMRFRLKVVSVHNFFPIPGVIKTGKGAGDLFLLSHPDREERLNAVKWTLRTIEHAHELESDVVVLHCGRVEMEPGIGKLHEFYRSGQIESDEAQAFIAKMIDYRNCKKPRHIDALLFSLDRLIRAAERYHVILALENRYHYHELPGTDDFLTIFNELDGAPLGYWHDTGHAHVNEVLSMGKTDTLLNMNRDRLVGVHLHDAIGLDDHLPPGTGDIDFPKILTGLKPDAIKVIELKTGTGDFDIAAGIEHIGRLENELHENDSD
jgi:sugar phosphate isomerase/epimerase